MTGPSAQGGNLPPRETINPLKQDITKEQLKTFGDLLDLTQVRRLAGIANHEFIAVQMRPYVNKLLEKLKTDKHRVHALEGYDFLLAVLQMTDSIPLSTAAFDEWLAGAKADADRKITDERSAQYKLLVIYEDAPVAGYENLLSLAHGYFKYERQHEDNYGEIGVALGRMLFRQAQNLTAFSPSYQETRTHASSSQRQE